MDLKLNRENLTCSVPIIDTEVTQAAEHDFILPDYCPDIFRVLKCFVIPGVTSTGINGDRLTFELSVTIRVIYRGESKGLHCIEQTLDFSKTVDLPADTADPSVKITPAVEYVNCRVVNQRRLDVRANVICRVIAIGEKKCEAVSDAFGCGIQLRKTPVVFPAKRIVSAKRITVIEEMELAAGKPLIGSILRLDTAVKKGEQKVIPGKLVTKGEATVSMLYLPKDGGDKPPEQMKFSIPFSQIIDIGGIEEGYEPETDITAAKCIVTPKADEPSTLECELVLLVNITALRYDTRELVTDAYSTMYECECEELPCAPDCAPQRIDASVSLQTDISCSDGKTDQVYDLWCERPTVSARYDENGGCITLYGKATFCMLAKLGDGVPAYSEKECAFEQKLEIGDDDPKLYEAAPTVSVRGCSYTIGEDGVRAKAELEIGGSRKKKLAAKLLSGLNVRTDKPKACDGKCAVKICYTGAEESLWDIAKKYSTSAQAIAEENDTGGDNAGRILIIPMKQ